ncbi:MAG: hypothetical protein K8J09_08060 [Planctomycetes bacterium]|nr:hypothetical protein [Planctomycetota bacterium]MCC7398037.1 hypothetical protein [Planctomycetota bacterium]
MAEHFRRSWRMARHCAAIGIPLLLLVVVLQSSPPREGPAEASGTPSNDSVDGFGSSARDETPRTAVTHHDGAGPSVDIVEGPRTLAELAASHLRRAPTRLQGLARDLFVQQAEHFAKKMAAADGRDLASVLGELDDRYAERLRRVAADQLALGNGLLVVEGMSDYQEQVKGRPFLLWNGGESLLGRSLQVLVIVDQPDPDLSAIDKSYRDCRGAMLAEKLVAFNAKPVEERMHMILEFKKLLAAGQADGPWFGVEAEKLRHVMVDERTWIVLPVD